MGRDGHSVEAGKAIQTLVPDINVIKTARWKEREYYPALTRSQITWSQSNIHEKGVPSELIIGWDNGQFYRKETGIYKRC